MEIQISVDHCLELWASSRLQKRSDWNCDHKTEKSISRHDMNQKMTKLAVVLAAGVLAGTSYGSVVDLTQNDSGSINDALFYFSSKQPTGTGVIDPFLRVQNDPQEEGYNTSGGTPFDDKAGTWTHDIQFSDLQSTKVTVNGTAYYQLLLDVNEPNGTKSLISLDSLQFYTSATGSKTTTDLSQLGSLRWSLDGKEDSYVLLDAARNSGSGSGDMYAYIPATAFSGVANSDFIYMYCRFGDQVSADGTSEGGFEEWSLAPAPVPEVGALFPIIGVVTAAGATSLLRRRRIAIAARALR
jgi:hypothetical protein